MAGTSAPHSELGWAWASGLETAGGTGLGRAGAMAQVSEGASVAAMVPAREASTAPG